MGCNVIVLMLAQFPQRIAQGGCKYAPLTPKLLIWQLALKALGMKYERLGLVHLVEMRLISHWIDPWLFKTAERLDSLLDGSNNVKHLIGFGGVCLSTHLVATQRLPAYAPAVGLGRIWIWHYGWRRHQWRRQRRYPLYYQRSHHYPISSSCSWSHSLRLLTCLLL